MKVRHIFKWPAISMKLVNATLLVAVSHAVNTKTRGGTLLSSACDNAAINVCSHQYDPSNLPSDVCGLAAFLINSTNTCLIQEGCNAAAHFFGSKMCSAPTFQYCTVCSDFKTTAPSTTLAPVATTPAPATTLAPVATTPAPATTLAPLATTLAPSGATDQVSAACDPTAALACVTNISPPENPSCSDVDPMVNTVVACFTNAGCPADVAGLKINICDNSPILELNCPTCSGGTLSSALSISILMLSLALVLI